MTSLSRERLAAVPAVALPVPPPVEAALAESVRYLGSDAALRSLEADTYWPKWDSPWWHMLLLFELGEARRIPERVVRALVAGLNAFPVKSFPLRVEDLPAGLNPYQHVACHCQVGSGYQVLAACGVDVDREVPWVGSWFPRYQMADGGLNCDSDAYLVEGECPSSMVGTVAPLEAVLVAEMTVERAAFVDRAAAFLIERRLMLGSSSVHNAAERAREPDWLKPCFPRFYFYDVLRGLRALLRAAEVRGSSIPSAAIEPVVSALLGAFPDGVVRLGRHAFEGTNTVTMVASGPPTRSPASRFPLLDAVSEIGAPSPTLTRHFAEVRGSLLRLLEENRILSAAPR